MSVDLSGAFASRYEQDIERAMKAESSGAPELAARHYRDAARSLEKLIPSVRSDEVRRDMRAKLDGLREKAGALERGESPGRSGDGKRASKSGQSEREREREDEPIKDAVLAMLKKSAVKWDDIAGLADVKMRIRTSYAMALAARPEGIEIPAVGNLLLYGPPGTGKTMLAAAVSGQLGATFFSARFSDLLSKYFGESSKIVAELFRAARERSPAVVFLDDFEALVASRDGDSSGAERRVLGELLVALDGLDTKRSDKFVLTIAATNKPWLIDDAALSRFGLRVCVPLPDARAREAMFKIHLPRRGYKLVCEVGELAEATEGYSGRELEALTRVMITDMLRAANPELERTKSAEEAKRLTLKTLPLGKEDLDRAKGAIKPSTTTASLAEYDGWTAQYGAGM